MFHRRLVNPKMGNYLDEQCWDVSQWCQLGFHQTYQQIGPQTSWAPRVTSNRDDAAPIRLVRCIPFFTTSSVVAWLKSLSEVIQANCPEPDYKASRPNTYYLLLIAEHKAAWLSWCYATSTLESLIWGGRYNDLMMVNSPTFDSWKNSGLAATCQPIHPRTM